MNTETVHIRYKVGSISQSLHNVNLSELRMKLTSLVERYANRPQMAFLEKVMWVGDAQQKEVKAIETNNPEVRAALEVEPETAAVEELNSPPELKAEEIPEQEEEEEEAVSMKFSAPTMETQKQFGNFVDALVKQLVTTDNLVLQQDVGCSFFTNWWRSKTRADTVVCLLDAAVQAEAKKEQEQLDAKLRSFLGASSTTTTTNTQEAAKKWLENWNRTHGVTTM